VFYNKFLSALYDLTFERSWQQPALANTLANTARSYREVGKVALLLHSGFSASWLDLSFT